MKILFVTPETPVVGGGGIATYIKHAKASFESQGHEVYTLSWAFREDSATFHKVGSTRHDRVVALSGEDIWRTYPNGPFNVALSYYLLPHIRQFIEDITPDIIETTDFKSPMYGYLAERRAGRLVEYENIPVIGFNHGLTRLLYSKNGVLPQPHAQGELAAERQAIRWCDAVFIPSKRALQSFEYQVGKLETSKLVSEPFMCPHEVNPTFAGEMNLFHLGRVSFAKGLDHEIHFVNVLSSIKDINSVHFVGSRDHLPFRQSEVEEYLDRRLAKSLKDRVVLHGPTQPNQFDRIFGAGGYSMNFSNQETFNYAFVEMVSHGLFPYIKAGTPMEEFLPEGLRHLCLPHDFDLRGLEKVVHDVEERGISYFDEIVSHIKTLTNPARQVGYYELFLEERKKATNTNQRKQAVSKYTGSDITVLMATFNNPEIIKETIASLRSQSVQPGEVVVLDDGSNLPEAHETLDWVESLTGFKVIRSKSNEGLCASRVKLLEHANTALSVFLDSDDLLAPDYFRKTLDAMNGSHLLPEAVLTWRRNFGVSNELVIMDLLGDHYHVMRNDFRMTALIRTDVLKKIGFDSSMRNGEADDWLFWLEFNRLGHKTVMVGEALFLYRFAEGSMSWPWSEGQATLTGIDIAKFLATHRGELSKQAFEDIYGERIWHQLNSHPEQQQGYDQFTGETFNALFRWAVRLRQSRPRMFWVGQKVSRGIARLVKSN